MNVTEVEQVVVDPSVEEVPVSTIQISHKTWLKLKVGRMLHPFGIHTWVRWKQWDPASQRAIDTGGRVCEFCPAGLMP